MKDENRNNQAPLLNNFANEQKRQKALRQRCEEYRERLKNREPQEVASLAAVSLLKGREGKLFLSGNHLLETYTITWPGLAVTDSSDRPADQNKEALWLHYLDRADGSPLTRRWVNLSEIGGLFYQQAFQGYCGDELAAAWGENLQRLREKALALGGWELDGPGDLAVEWRVLPRLPLCLCYRLPAGTGQAWATMLFDAAAGHYVAADVAAITAKDLADRIKP